MIYFLCYNLWGQIQLVNDCDLFSTPVFISHCEYDLLTKWSSLKYKTVWETVGTDTGSAGFMFHAYPMSDTPKFRVGLETVEDSISAPTMDITMPMVSSEGPFYCLYYSLYAFILP